MLFHLMYSCFNHILTLRLHKKYSFQVVMFQTYINQTSKPIEPKYVFPLDDRSAACGFEAFINGNHVTGEVKCFLYFDVAPSISRSGSTQLIMKMCNTRFGFSCVLCCHHLTGFQVVMSFKRILVFCL